MISEKKALTWEHQNRPFTFVCGQHASDKGMLILPTGQCLELTMDEWRLLSQALAKAIPKNPPNENLPANAGKPWNPQLDETLKAAWFSGAALAEIAQRFQRTTGSIRGRLIGLGFLGRFDSEDEANRLSIEQRKIPFQQRLGAAKSPPPRHPDPDEPPPDLLADEDIPF